MITGLPSRRKVLVGLLIRALGVGGFDPFTTTPLLSLHFRRPKNSRAATKRTSPNVPATLMPTIAPFDRSGELLSFPGADVLAGLDMVLEPLVEGLNVELTLELLGEVDVEVEVDVEYNVVNGIQVGVVFTGDLVDLDVDVEDVVVSKIAALSVLLDSFAAARLLSGQPSSLLQASLKQQPMNGVSKLEQVYQVPAPEHA